MSEKNTMRGKDIVREALASIEDIATLPEVTMKIIKVVDDADSHPDELYQVIKHDPALVSRVLRVVNSAFYGLPGQVSNIRRAIALLGLAAIKNIAIAASMGKMFHSSSGQGAFNPQDLWKHSMAVAVAARKICNVTGQNLSGDEMFMTGLIHDLGLIVESQVFGDKLSGVCESSNNLECSFLELEQEIIGANHQDFGDALTLKWRFPRQIRAGVSYHHTPGMLDGGTRKLAALLFCADTICCRQGLGFSHTAVNQEPDPEILQWAGMEAENIPEVVEGLAEDVEDALSVFSPED